MINEYVKAIGGKDALAEVTSIEIKATSNIQGTVLEMYSVKNNQNQSLMEMSAMGMTICLLYTSPSPRDLSTSRMPSSA